MSNKSSLRPNNAKSQWQFDNLIADTDISGLRFLLQKYKKDLGYFRNSHDLNNDDSFSEYREIQQRYKMIGEELDVRVSNINASSTYKSINKRTSFDSQTGVVYDEEGMPTYTVDFNEDETDTIIRDIEGIIVESFDDDYDEIDDDDYDDVNLPKTKKEMYGNWKYWKDEA